MKLIIKQYLASLKERDELDAILPDLLSQLGLVVFSRPSRGTRQDGVDVAAVGKLANDEEEKVYLFSIKAGDLTRSFWDGDSVQSLRPSLNEIQDVYIPNRLPSEHKDKQVVICLCFGGDIQEQVRPQVEGYIKGVKNNNVSFEEWNGDKLASLISESFLREDLLPENSRSNLRKALALLDEPEASYNHFFNLMLSFSNKNGKTKDKEILTRLRQINICLWILFSWARDSNNLESPYLSSELALLHSWELSKSYFSTSNKLSKEIQAVYFSIFEIYLQISMAYLRKILPLVYKSHALSSAIPAYSNIDINLKIFDILSRISIGSIAINLEAQICHFKNTEFLGLFQDIDFDDAIKNLIENNPALLLPLQEEQTIDIAIAINVLMANENYHPFVKTWLMEMLNRADFAFATHSKYPCHSLSYIDLLTPPEKDDNYRKEVTASSVLFPMIAFWAAILNDAELFERVQFIKNTHLAHCNFQFWYPDNSSEDSFYTNNETHGATLLGVNLTDMNFLLKQVFSECETEFLNLSAIKTNFDPIILIACRHYKLPIPIHFWNSDLSKDSFVNE